MAEGDSIWRLARRLRQQICGATVEASQFRVAAFATSDVTGALLVDVVPRGKHLLFRMDNGLTLHSHLRMQGSWRLHRAGWRPGPRSGNSVRLWLDLGSVGVLAAHDMPVLDLVRTDDEGSVVGHLGPDILGDDWDFDVAERNLVRIPDRPISEALLDQRNLCGIGNLYKVEGLFLAGVHPMAPVGRIVRLHHVVELTQRMMRLNLERPTQPTTGDRRRGQRHWIYGRAGRPCRRCATPIEFHNGGSSPYDRETWWCPHCQPMA